MVEVDPDTGQKKSILRVVVTQDASRAIHQSYVEGQYQGGAAQDHRLITKRGVYLQPGRAARESRLSRLSHFSRLRPADE